MVRLTLGINSHDNTLAAKSLCPFSDNVGILYGSRVNGYLVRSRLQHATHVFNATQASANCEGNENLLGDPLYNVNHGVTSFRSGSYVQKDQLIGTLSVVESSQFHRVASISKVSEAGALNYSALSNIKARDNPSGQHLLTPSI
jgi:hypothetical protein